MTTTFKFLSACVEPFRFRKHQREARATQAALAAEQAAAERSHQLAMLDRITSMVENLVDGQARQASEQAAALVQIAKANQAQAEVFSNWMQSFHTSDAPTSSVVTEEQEWAQEQQKLFESLGITPDTAGIPEEFKLALQLQQGITDLGASAPN